MQKQLEFEFQNDFPETDVRIITRAIRLLGNSKQIMINDNYEGLKEGDRILVYVPEPLHPFITPAFYIVTFVDPNFNFVTANFEFKVMK